MTAKRLSTILVLLTALLIIVACGGRTTPEPTVPPQQPTAEKAQPTVEKITISVAHPVWFSDHDWHVKKIKEWDAMNPNVTVKLVELPSPDGPYREKLVLDLASGQGPDVYLADTFWFGEFAEAGYLADLTSLANAWDGWSQWIGAAKGAVTYKGKVYGLNRTTDVRPLYYRKDLVKKAGIETPWQPKSWDEMLEAARKLKKIGVKAPWMVKAGKVAGEGTTMQGFYMLYLGCGGHLWKHGQVGHWQPVPPRHLRPVL